MIAWFHHLYAENQPKKKEGSMSLFNAKEFQLKNGLKIILIKQLSQAITVNILYKIGTADDPEGYIGLSHFLEHMMFRGTKKYPGTTFKDKVSKIGGYINAFTSFDMTCYENRVPMNHLEEILEMEADRMTELAFNKKDVDFERKAVEEEYRARIVNSAFGPIEEVIYRNTYLYHPYGILPIGYPHHIKAYTKENALAWYKKWYHPNNAIVIIAGDIDFDTTLAMVEKYFGSLKTKTLPQRTRVKEPDIKGATRYIKQENERFAFPVIEFIYDAPKKDYVYDFARYMLGGGTLSLFYNHFVRKLNNGIQNVSIYYHFMLDDPNNIAICFEVSPNVNLQQVVFDTFQQYKQELLAGYLESDAFKERFETAKTRIIGNLIHRTDGTLNAAENFILMAYDISFQDINHYADILRKITLDDVKQTIKVILAQKPKVVFIGVPSSTTPSQYAVRME